MEQWKDIKNYEGLYQISNRGRVKSLNRRVWNPCYGGRYDLRKERILNIWPNGDGYLQATLNKSGKRKAYLVSRLVAQAFVPNPENKPEVNHKSGIKTDNRIENLEWVTRSENMKHAVENGLFNPVKGDKNGRAKLTVGKVMCIKEMFLIGLSNVNLSNIYGVSSMTILDIKTGRTWKHIQL